MRRSLYLVYILAMLTGTRGNTRGAVNVPIQTNKRPSLQDGMRAAFVEYGEYVVRRRNLKAKGKGNTISKDSKKSTKGKSATILSKTSKSSKSSKKTNKQASRKQPTSSPARPIPWPHLPTIHGEVPTHRNGFSPSFDEPTMLPSERPSISPFVRSELPSTEPSGAPTFLITELPTVPPTVQPTLATTQRPSHGPTIFRSISPTEAPTEFFSQIPSAFFSEIPTEDFSREPTTMPTESVSPTARPSDQATSISPSTSRMPASSPMPSLSMIPSKSWSPSIFSSRSQHPSSQPTAFPMISVAPSSHAQYPSVNPTNSHPPEPSVSPLPSIIPSESTLPTATSGPTISFSPSFGPSQTMGPSLSSGPSTSGLGSITPSQLPSISPSERAIPTELPTGSIQPSGTNGPSEAPSLSLEPTVSSLPSWSTEPSVEPTITISPSNSNAPSSPPSGSSSPSTGPTSMPTVSFQPSSDPTSTANPSQSSGPSMSPSVSEIPVTTLEPTISLLPSTTPTYTVHPSNSVPPSGFPSVSLSPSEGPTLVPTISVQPSPFPTYTQSPSQSTVPSVYPTSTGIPTPSLGPSISFDPSSTPTGTKTPTNSIPPSSLPNRSVVPSATATPTDTAQPSSYPSVTQNPSLSRVPTNLPSTSREPSVQPSSPPSKSMPPSTFPTRTFSPTESAAPTKIPSLSQEPSYTPTSSPTHTLQPSLISSVTASPTISAGPSFDTGTSSPSALPLNSQNPTLTSKPSSSRMPSSIPSQSPRPTLTVTPTSQPSLSLGPTAMPSASPSESLEPTYFPSVSHLPTASSVPSLLPTISINPTRSALPSEHPTVFLPSGGEPSFPTPTQLPSVSPSKAPSFVPSWNPSSIPTTTGTPTITANPTRAPVPATPSPSALTIRRELTLFTLEYEFVAFDEPTVSDLNELESLTNSYLQTYMQGAIGSSEVLLVDFITDAVSYQSQPASSTVLVSFRSEAYFDPVTPVFPTEAELVDEMVNSFTGNDLTGYLGMLQALPNGNPFSTSAAVFVVGNTEADDEVMGKEKSLIPIIALVAASIAFVSTGSAGFAYYRRRRLRRREASDKFFRGAVGESTDGSSGRGMDFGDTEACSQHDRLSIHTEGEALLEVGSKSTFWRRALGIRRSYRESLEQKSRRLSFDCEREDDGSRYLSRPFDIPEIEENQSDLEEVPLIDDMDSTNDDKELLDSSYCEQLDSSSVPNVNPCEFGSEGNEGNDWSASNGGESGHRQDPATLCTLPNVHDPRYPYHNTVKDSQVRNYSVLLRDGRSGTGFVAGLPRGNVGPELDSSEDNLTPMPNQKAKLKSRTIESSIGYEKNMESRPALKDTFEPECVEFCDDVGTPPPEGGTLGEKECAQSKGISPMNTTKRSSFFSEAWETRSFLSESSSSRWRDECSRSTFSSGINSTGVSFAELDDM